MHVVLALVHGFVHSRGVSRLIENLRKRYVLEGDTLAHEALECIRELERALNALVLAVDPAEAKRRSALKNAQAVLRKLKPRKGKA